ncbi:MAG: FecR family protein [Tannerella sp.]|jgi:ferric-dicitrate binding protein FerR (iron transport regulator)|nr:FecR family protein [Tannerella sp.]
MEKQNLRDIRAGLERIKSKEDTELMPDNERQELWSRIVKANERHCEARSNPKEKERWIASFLAMTRYRPTIPARNDVSSKPLAGFKTTARVDECPVRHDTRNRRLIVCLAGVAATVALIFVIAKYTPKQLHNKPSYIIYNIASGLKTPLTLSDGTQVWVNSGSTLAIPDKFDDSKREITVSGEVFLDVAPSDKRPFTVKTNGMDITVKGTRFNVKAYPKDENTFVVLEEGSIIIATNDGNKMEIHPEQMFTRNNNTGKNKLETVNVSEHIAWKDGYYYFNKQNMDVVLTKISEHYGIQIKWDDNIANMTCSGKLDMKTDYTQTLDALSKAAPIEIKYKNNQIHIELNP